MTGRYDCPATPEGIRMSVATNAGRPEATRALIRLMPTRRSAGSRSKVKAEPPLAMRIPQETSLPGVQASRPGSGPTRVGNNRVHPNPPGDPSPVVGSLLRDVRTAVRALLKAPGFTAVVLLTLAVAIGANTAIFSVVDGVLLSPLPYPDADRLVRVAAATRPEVGGGGEVPFSDRGYWHFVDNSLAFEQFGGYSLAPTQWPLTGEGSPPAG